MGTQAEIRVDLDRIHGRISPEIYGQFMEHVGRSVYGGVFEPGSKLADKDGYRIDVLEAAAELKPSVLRWPGGNFASGYHWRDGVGSKAERPTRHDLAWTVHDTNAFGTEEYGVTPAEGVEMLGEGARREQNLARQRRGSAFPFKRI